MKNPVLETIASRRSIRSYKNQKLTKEQIDTLLTAAQQAPSARNLQPWHFTVVQNRELLNEISAEAAKVIGQDTGDIFHGAVFAIFLSGDSSNKWSRIDCGIAVQTLALAAESMGLGSVILGRPDPVFTGPRADYFKQKLAIPATHSFAIAIAIGVPAGTKEAHPVEQNRVSFVN
ncbi:MAG: nitroreductase [Treponema sp.]|nr:nitroreductase [Treponema sp.]